MPPELSVGLIGLGGKGRSHAVNLAALPGVRIAALCDVESAMIDQARRQLGAAGEASYGTTDAAGIFDDRNVDAVVISTQHDSHAPLTIAAAEAKKHILCEKPLALTLDECLAMERAVRANGVQLVMGFNHRHRALVQLARQRVPQPRFINASFVDLRWPDDFWAVDPIKGGGNVLSQGCHAVDLLNYFAGADPVRVYATGGVMSHDPAVTPTIDTVMATVTYANGVLAVLVLGDFGPAPYSGGAGSIFHLYAGEGVAASVAQDALQVFYSAGRGTPTQREEHSVLELPPAERTDVMGAAALAREFVACARENRPPAIAADVRAGRAATTLVLSAFASITSGQPVEIAL
jgi:myo-inositol 2-dehydrogenase/D-chiro-inositol 1-dehydrogenase